jgi:hypothetical protein
MEALRTLGTVASNTVSAMNMNTIARVQSSLYAPGRHMRVEEVQLRSLLT